MRYRAGSHTSGGFDGGGTALSQRFARGVSLPGLSHPFLPPGITRKRGEDARGAHASQKSCHLSVGLEQNRQEPNMSITPS